MEDFYSGLCNYLAERVIKQFTNTHDFESNCKNKLYDSSSESSDFIKKKTFSTKTTQKVYVKEHNKNWGTLLEKCKFPTILDYNGRISQFSKHSSKRK